MGNAWRSRVVDHGIIVPRRALWISLQMDGHVLGVLSVYEPSVTRQRADFWIEISNALPIVDSWIVGGDFNNVESIGDVDETERRLKIPPFPRSALENSRTKKDFPRLSTKKRPLIMNLEISALL